MRRPLTLRYVESDSAMGSVDSFLSLLVTEAVGRPVEVVHNAKKRVDLQLTSVQLPLARKFAREAARVSGRWLPRRAANRDPRWRVANPEPRGDADAHLWFTGENLRPPAGSWDGYFSFDMDTLGGRNAYVPLWWYSAGLFGSASSLFMSGMPGWELMLQARDPGSLRRKFACAFINNPEPMRLHAIQILDEVGPVDVFGSAVGRPVPDKNAVAKDYRFVLCFENDIYPGYVTEKPFEAWSTGAVPLWRGSDPAGYLNPAAILNAANAKSLDEFAEMVALVDADPGIWQRVASQPIISRGPDLGPAIDLVRRILA